MGPLRTGSVVKVRCGGEVAKARVLFVLDRPMGAHAMVGLQFIDQCTAYHYHDDYWPDDREHQGRTPTFRTVYASALAACRVSE